MPPIPILVNIQGAQELRALSRRLREAGRGDLQRELVREIRREGKPVVRDLRRAVMAVDVSSTQGGMARPQRSTNLRARTARATKLRATRTGVLFRTYGKRVDPNPRLPKYLDATVGRFDRWRHPVFAKKGLTRAEWTWERQTGEPWFFVTIRRHVRDFRRACFDAIRTINDRIAS